MYRVDRLIRDLIQPTAHVLMTPVCQRTMLSRHRAMDNIHLTWRYSSRPVKLNHSLGLLPCAVFYLATWVHYPLICLLSSEGCALVTPASHISTFSLEKNHHNVPPVIVADILLECQQYNSVRQKYFSVSTLKDLLPTCCRLISNILTCQDSSACRWQVRNRLATFPSTRKLRRIMSN